VLTDLGDWFVYAAAGEKTLFVSCSQMHLEDAVRLTWACARARHSTVNPTAWVLRCESSPPGSPRTILYAGIEDGTALVPYELLG